MQEQQLKILQQREFDKKSCYKKHFAKYYLPDKVKNIDYVECPIYNERFRHLGSHFKGKHSLSIKEYIKEHPEVKLCCENYTKIQGKEISKGKKYGKKHFYNWKQPINILIEKEGWDYIYCKICNKPFRNLGVHLKNIHNLDTLDYLNQFPNSSLIADKIKKNNKKLSRRPIKERVGEKRAKEISERLIDDHKTRKERGVYQKTSNSLKGRSKEELFGKERAKDMKQYLSDLQLNRSSEEKKRITDKARIKLEPIWESRKGKKRDPEIGKKISKSLKEGHRKGTIIPANTDKHCIRIKGTTLLQGEKRFRSAVEYLYNEILKKQSNNGNDFIYFYEDYVFPLSNIESNITFDFILVFDWGIEKVKDIFKTTLLNKEQIKFIVESSVDWKIEEVKGKLGLTECWYKKEKAFKEQYSNILLEIVYSNYIVSRLFKYNIPSYKDILLQYGKSKQAIKYREQNL